MLSLFLCVSAFLLLFSQSECDVAVASSQRSRSFNGSIMECLDSKSFPFPFLAASARYAGESGAGLSVQLAHRPWPYGAYRVYALSGGEGAQLINSAGADVRFHDSAFGLNGNIAVKWDSRGAARARVLHPLDLSVGLLLNGDSMSPHTAFGNVVLGAEVYRASDKQSMQGTFGLRSKIFSPPPSSRSHLDPPPTELGVSVNTLGHVVASTSCSFSSDFVAALQVESNLTGSDTKFAFGFAARRLWTDDASPSVRLSFRPDDIALSVEGYNNIGWRLSWTSPFAGVSWATSRFGIGVEYNG